MVLTPPPPKTHPVKGEDPLNDNGWNLSHHPLHGHTSAPPRRRAKPKTRAQRPADSPIEQWKHYLALFIGEDGQVQLKTSASLRNYEKRILSTSIVQQFQDAVKTSNSEAERHAQSTISLAESETPQEQDVSLMSVDTNVGAISPLFQRPHKRPRVNTDLGSIPRNTPRGSKNIRTQTVQDGVRKMISFQMGDTAQAEKWIVEAFEAVQQVTCRLIAKLWIKKIEPKKQSAHPYNGGLPKNDPIKDPERTKPPYWPPRVPHKEPDHIQKNQRIELLTYLVMHTPHRQLVPKDKLGDEISAEALQAQTAERKNDIPPEKYEILQEIFKLRQLMEMYNDGGIDGATVVHVIDCSKTTRLDQGETEEDIEDDAPVHSEELDDDSEETEHAGGVMLTPASSSMPSPVEQQHMQSHKEVNKSASSSFSNQASDVSNHHQPLRRQVRPYDEHFEPSMGGEIMERIASNAMTYNQPGFNQSTYSQLQMAQPPFQQRPSHPPMEHHETTRWADYSNSNAFNQVSHMGAPVQAEPVMTEYGMYGGAHIGSMNHGLPCTEDFYQQHSRINQMQRQSHHHRDLIPQLASQTLREIPIRTASAQSAQHMAISRHNNYDEAMVQNSFYSHM